MSTAYFNLGLFTLSVALLENLEDPSWRLCFLLCIRCWKDLYFCYPIFRDIAQAFLSMAMEKGAMTSGEAQKVLEGLGEYGRHHTAPPADTTTTFIFDPTAEEPEASRVHTMALRFDEMVLFDQVTEGVLGAEEAE